MKKILVLVLLMFSSVAFATEYVSTDGLTEQQQAEIALQVAKLKNTKDTSISETVRSEANAWGELGVNIGHAVVGAAKEVGVAANEFSQTPLGKVTVAVVVYKIIGQDILGVLVGGFILIVGLWFAFRILKSTIGANVEYEYVPFLFGFWQRKRVKKVTESDEWATARFIVSIIAAVLAVIVSLFVIF